MKSILQDDRRCYLCGRTAQLDRHHVFGGSNRKNSERYGLTVYLCHDSCHIFGKTAVHQSAAVAAELKKEVQLKAMNYYGWNEEDFRKIFGRSSL